MATKMQILLLVLCSLLCLGTAADRFKKKDAAGTTKPKPPTLNTDLVPTLEEILAELGMESRAKDLYRMGVVDTRILLRLKKMDFHMMTMEWADVTEEETNRLRAAVEKYIIQATVTEEVIEEVDYSHRNKLKFGRIYVPSAVQAFEYLAASFGGPPPIGLKKLAFSQDPYGCSNHTQDLKDSIVIVQRGECSFLVKAQLAKRSGAVAIGVVNDRARLDNIASGYGIDPNITEEAINEVSKLSVFSLSLSSLQSLRQAASASSPSLAQIIPVKCGTSGTCLPVLDEEKTVKLEVTAGFMRVALDGQTRAFDFLTSTFGGVLPATPITVLATSPLDACSEVGVAVDESASGAEGGGLAKPFALYVQRGGCRFEVKAENAQRAGASLVIISDTKDEALQRVGASPEGQEKIGIPAVLIAGPNGETLHSMISQQEQGLSVELVPAKDDFLSDSWIDLAFASFEDLNEQDTLLHIDGLVEMYTDRDSKDIVAWLERKRMAVLLSQATKVEAR